MKGSLSRVIRSRSLSRAIAVIAMGSATHGLYAQEVAELEEITVTGSRITQTDGMISPVPVTTISPAELSSFDPGGTVSEQLDVLPQFFGNLSSQSSTGALNFGSGSSRLNLRNLGSQRTLVLFDGSRVVPSNTTSSVDIDAFPTALVRSVDVVTGGASAAYGADALGGVVNFVLDREFDGLKVQGGGGVTEWGDGERWNVSVAGGKSFGERLHVVGSVEARRINQILRAPEDLDNDWWQRWGHVTNPAWSPGAAIGIPQRLTLPWVSSTDHTPTGMIDAPGFSLDNYVFTNDAQDVRPFIPGDVVGTNSQSGGPEGQIANRAFQSGPMGAETIGRSGFAAVKYDFSDSLSGFAQVMVGRSESNSPDRRSAYNLRGGWAATIYRDNAYLPASVAQAMDARGISSFRLQKSGSFLGDNSIGLGDGRAVYSLYSWSTGLDWEMPNGWDARLSWQRGESTSRAGLYGQTRVDRMFLGMDAVRDPATGAIVCRVQLFNPTEAQLANTPGIKGRVSVAGGPLRSPVGLDNSIRDCVPYNVMGAGNISDAAVAYTQSARIDTAAIEQDFGELLVNGELFEGWSGPVSFAAGLTWREQEFEQRIISDVYEFGPPVNAPELGILGIAPLYIGGSETLHLFTSARDSQGDMNVWEWFGELNVPFWQSGGGSQRLDGSASFRSSDYSRSGRIETWKIGLDFQVFEDLRLRTTKSLDVREPTFQELFDNRGGGGGTVDDPVTNTTYPTSVKGGGNARLLPEVANTLVAGVVYAPSWLDGLQLSTDWYEVDVRDAVGTLGAQRIVDGCYRDNIASFCPMIHRDPASNLIVMVENGYLNVAKARVEGVDFEATYRTDVDMIEGQEETLDARLLGGYTIERSDTPLDGLPRDIAGEINAPDLTVIGTLSYDVGPIGMQLQQRYIADTLLNVDWVEGRDVDDNSVSSGNYTSLRLSYRGDMNSGGTWNVSFNVNNLFDRPPPVVPSFGAGGNAQTIPNGYDDYGRRYQLGFNIDY
ncbi:MAG: TonB-dependent receptor [Pseudomonadota bacterium]